MSNAIESVLVETRVFPPPERAAQGAAIPSMDAYNALCAQVENDFDGFWAGQARDNLTSVSYTHLTLPTTPYV